MAAAAYFLVFFILSHPLLLHSAEKEPKVKTKCPSFYCGNAKENMEHPEIGYLTVDNCIEQVQKIQLKMRGELYDVESIFLADTIDFNSKPLHHHHHYCHRKYSDNFNFSRSPYLSFKTTFDQNQLKCNLTHPLVYFSYVSSPICGFSSNDSQGVPSPQCLSSHPAINITHAKKGQLFSLSAADIFFQVQVNEFYHRCYFKGVEYKGGKCTEEINGTVQCTNEDEDKGNNYQGLKIGLGLGIGFPAALIICFLIFFISRCHYNQKHASSDFLMRNISAESTSKSEFDRAGVFFGVPIFSYSELQEATNNFDSTKELGDGGFGTVYYGTLQDGREVAVKRLYESNYRRVQQFINEVEILTRLHHKNLVSLYGCTSRHSRELLLVYKFIPNGTVADHLHGDKAEAGSLTWPIRMSIAIETAEALAFLHASDIVHRDVKTNNILLDNNFCVKVADFGLLRLFPTDVSHVSTAPQGTPGYVDSEYHQCYQLTDKSDVYSFGVVLIELISSMPAVDMSRDRHEINLANLALNRIQNCAFDELVDPCLGFESNLMVRRMTTSVAEVAFRCLQQDKEMRPSMDEVLEVLKGIESEKYEAEDDVGVLKSIPPPNSLDSDDVRLLKNMQKTPSLPISVTDKWVSRSTTPSASAEAFLHSA